MGVTACVSTISTTVFIASVALAHTLSPKLKKHVWFIPAHRIHHIHSWSWIKFYVFDFLSLNTTCMFHVELIYDISTFMLMCTWHWLSWVVHCTQGCGMFYSHKYVWYAWSDVISKPNMKQSITIAILCDFIKIYCAIMSYVVATYKLFLYVDRSNTNFV